MSFLSVLLGEELAARDARLPPSDTTFVYPAGAEVFADTDEDAVQYLSPAFADPSALPAAIAPLRTTGDGNCAVHALSRALWGVEIYHGLLRDALLKELLDHSDWYRSRFGLAEPSAESGEWDAIVAAAGTDRAHLGFAHFQALANAVRRTLIVLAGPSDVAEFGAGEDGCAASFLPLRHRPADCPKLPLVLAWADEHKKHFVPLVRVENNASSSQQQQQQQTLPPHVAVAYLRETDGGTEAQLWGQYVDFSEPPKHAPAHVLLKGQAQEQRRAAAEAAAQRARSVDSVRAYIEMFNLLLRKRQKEAQAEQALLRRAVEMAGFAAQRDIVVPVQLGKSVGVLCGEYFGDHTLEAYRFLMAHGLSMRYISSVSLYLAQVERLLLKNGGKRPQQLDPEYVVPLARVQSDTASAVLQSLRGANSAASELPWETPVRFNRSPPKPLLEELVRTITANGGNGEYVLNLIEDAERFIQGQLGCTTNIEQLAVGFSQLFFALDAPSISFPALDALRFLSLAPIASSTCGHLAFLDKLAKRLAIARTPFVCHVAALQFFANALSIETVADEIVDTPEFCKYILALRNSSSQLIRKPLAALCLNAAILLPSAEYGLFFCQFILQMLRDEDDAGTLRILLLAIGTLFINDEGARTHSLSNNAARVLLPLSKKFPETAELAELVLNMITV